ncbi:MAG: DNA methylase [Sphaerochaetaceae bacterium]|nr:DNA methylase [Spirochaetales bacterium]MDY5967494.1 DNA methylase [Sphaerochaetaceae bacterium]
MSGVNEKAYIAIDLKSFFASVECIKRSLDPLDTNLVVADITRTEKTICLAVSPSLKSFGLSGRARLFEVVQKINAVNKTRLSALYGKPFCSKSVFLSEISKHKNIEVDYIVAPPNMALYVEISKLVYSTYLEFVSEEDIHVYSIDEVFIDATPYLSMYGCNAETLAMRMIRAVFAKTGITATSGIGPNLFLAKIAMDIEAKKQKPDANGVRIAVLDIPSYREKYWDYPHLDDFWMIGENTAKHLNRLGLYTMGDIALFSEQHENVIFKEFGVNGEFIIDHAWGYESVSISDIKNYKSKSKSFSSGQVLSEAYNYDDTRTILEEMVDNVVLSLTAKKMTCNKISLYIGYDAINVQNSSYKGRTKTDRYNKTVPYPLNTSKKLSYSTNLLSKIKGEFLELYKNKVDPSLLIRRLTVAVGGLEDDKEIKKERTLFDSDNKNEEELQIEINRMKKRYGKNILLKGISYTGKATMRERNKMIGGHKA